jgi:hypothetical protein
VQFLAQPGQPVPQPRRLDLLERRPVHPWCALVRARQIIGVEQNVRPPDLVVEHVEPKARLLLRPSPSQGHACRKVSSAKSRSYLVFAGSSPITSPHSLRKRTFPPPALPGLNATTTLSDARLDRCSSASLRPLPSSGPPPLARSPASLPPDLIP